MSMPGTIAYVITDLHTGGVPLHLHRLAVAMRERGWKPVIVSLAGGGAVADMLRRDRIDTFDCAAAGRWDVRVIPRLALQLRRVNPDIVHSFLFHANLAAGFAMPLTGRTWRRLVCEIQTVEIERRWHLIVGGMTQRMCRFVIGNSPSVVDHLRRRAHVAPSRLRCVPGGVDVERIRSAPVADRTTLGVKFDEKLLLWVGRFDPVKGLDELIDAMSVIAKEHPGTKLLLAGEGSYEAAIRNRVKHHNLANRVVFLGRRTDVASLMKAADVFVFPSRTEGMPNALLEAMAAGCPIVTTDVPGCRDLVANDVTGLVVPPNAPAAIARALGSVLFDRELAARLAAAAASHVAAHFTSAACFDRYESLYRLDC